METVGLRISKEGEIGCYNSGSKFQESVYDLLADLGLRSAYSDC